VKARARHGSLSLRLYVAGDSPNSAMAKRHLQAALAPLPEGSVTLEVVDVLVEPERSSRDGVLVTPTLIRVAPPPERRLIGNLRDRSALLAGLGLDELFGE
jgi:circadian clock protein KaiB